MVFVVVPRRERERERMMGARKRKGGRERVKDRTMGIIPRRQKTTINRTKNSTISISVQIL